MCLFARLYVHGYAKGMQMHACTHIHICLHMSVQVNDTHLILRMWVMSLKSWSQLQTFKLHRQHGCSHFRGRNHEKKVCPK